MLTKLNIVVAIALMACCTNLNAQDCGCGGFDGGGYGYAPISVGGGYGGSDCGREISQGNAAALWSDYCTESCADNSGGGGGCGLFSRLKGKCGGGGCGGGGFGYGGGGCGCDQGCFGYPSGGCGGGYGGGCGGGGGGCGLKGKLGGHFGGGCGRKCGRSNASSCGYTAAPVQFSGGCDSGGCGSGGCGAAPVQFSGGCDTCGCGGGDGGGYFSQPVGYDYGTSGMHSVVQGCATGACGG